MEKYGFYVIYIIFLGHAMCLPNGKILTKEEMENFIFNFKKEPKRVTESLEIFCEKLQDNKKSIEIIQTKVEVCYRCIGANGQDVQICETDSDTGKVRVRRNPSKNHQSKIWDVSYKFFEYSKICEL